MLNYILSITVNLTAYQGVKAFIERSDVEILCFATCAVILMFALYVSAVTYNDNSEVPSKNVRLFFVTVCVINLALITSMLCTNT